MSNNRPTKRAPDAGDSAAISSSFLRLIIFLAGRLRRPRPSAGNAIRWAVCGTTFMKMNKYSMLLFLFPVFSACTSIRTLTPTSIPTIAPTSTLQITETSIPTPIDYPINGYNTLLSPSGTKKAVYDAYLGRTFQVVNENATVLWSITYDVHKFDDSFGMLGEAWYEPFYWSKDENYLYYTCFHGGEIDGSGKYYGNEFIDGCGVFRLDIRTGEITDVLPEIAPLNGYYAFSLSPNEKYLVYTYQDEMPVQIKLLDLETNKQQILLTADDEVLEIGRYGWSPQGDKLVYMTLKIPEDETRLYSIFTLDLSSLETKLIIEDIDTRIRFASWQDEEVISYIPDTGGVIWQLSIDSKSFSISTMTPPIEFISTPTP